MLAIGIVNTDSAFLLNHIGLKILLFAALSAVKLRGGKLVLNMLVYIN